MAASPSPASIETVGVVTGSGSGLGFNDETEPPRQKLMFELFFVAALSENAWGEALHLSEMWQVLFSQRRVQQT